MTQKKLARSYRAKYDSDRCTCADCPPIEYELEQMQILFIGKATGNPMPTGEEEQLVTPFEILECLKGELPRHISLTHPDSSEACGYRFKVGKRVLWSAYYGDEEIAQSETYVTDGCAEPCYKEAEYRELLEK